MNRVSDDDRSTLFSFSARGASQGYAPQSGEIVGILKQLMAAQKEEEDRKANQAGLIAAKEEEIATLTATIETKLTQQGNLAAEVESLKNDVADTQRSLAADQELAAKLAESCRGQSSEWEERQKSRGKRGSLCARRRSRKTVTWHCLCVVEPVYIRPCCAADGGTRGELRGRASLVTVDVLTGHICSISFCLYVPMERDKYVWLVQSRRRPEKWTRTWRAGSRGGSATPDPVS